MSPPRLLYIDVLRSLAIIGVVWIHSFDPFVPHAPILGDTVSFSQIALASLARFAVPLYVVISGALLLNKPIPSLTEFYRRRLLRLAVPLAAWTGIYTLVDAFTQADFSFYQHLFRAVIFGQPFYLLFVLLGLYAITPFLSDWIHQTTIRKQLAVTGITLGLAALVSLTENWLLAGTNVLPIFSFNYFLYYLGYYLAGSLLPKLKPVRYLPAYILGAYLAIVTATTIFVGHFGSTPKGLVWYQYQSPIVIILVLALSWWVKDYLNRHSLPAAISKLATRVASYSLGIYFVHQLIIPWLQLVIPHTLPAFFNSYVFIGSLLISSLITAAGSRIKPVSFLLGFSA